MKTTVLVACSLLLMPSLFAVQAKGGASTVAAGYPAWTGITPKNHIMGRVLGADADLRQRITVVVEFDAAKAAEQLEQTGQLATYIGYNNTVGHGSANWETLQLPRDVMVIYVAHNANAKDFEKIRTDAKYKDHEKDLGRVAINSDHAPVYTGVTFEGAPANGGKLPFVYVMGHEGTEPLMKGAFDASTSAAVKKAITAGRKKIAEAKLKWRPFYGYVDEPKHFPDIEKALAKGKPLEPVEAKLKKSFAASDAEKAKEAQMLYDGLEQTKSDLIWFVRCSCRESPHVAAYNMHRVMKCWPSSKKALGDVSAKLKANKSAQPLIQMYAKMMEWSNPDFTCKNAGEAKKIKAELEKMKKQIAPMTNDKNINIQNGALTLDGLLDELIAVIETKVPQK